MRCYCCDHILTTQEATRRFKESGSFTDMCNACLSTIADEELETVDGQWDEEFDDDGDQIED